MEPPPVPPQKVRKHRIVLAGLIGIIIAILLVAVARASFVPVSDCAFMSERQTWLCAKCGAQLSSRCFILGGKRIGRTPAQLSDGFDKLDASTCKHELRRLGESVMIARAKPVGFGRMRNGRPAGDQFYTQKIVRDAMNSLAATNQLEARVVLDWLWRIRDSSSFPTNRLTALTTGDAMILKQQLCAETVRYFGR
jgi:hypothetical protein